ncbi:hypothetical protein ACWDR1_18280 [Streptosporangium sandarakinum]|uniref:hypothetical protein n=1 Tax=Streptosporangium sandarakinum TaxID=1260955 RepID=UPI0033B86150
MRPLAVAAGLALDGTASLRLPTLSRTAAFGYLGVIVTAAAFFLWYFERRLQAPRRAGERTSPPHWTRRPRLT